MSSITLRKIIFWPHLVSGVIAGIVIAIMSLTGAAIAFESEIVGWADSDARRVQEVLPGLFDHYRATGTTDLSGDRLTVRLLALAGPEQRRAAVKRLDGYRQDFALLAAR